MRKQDEDSNIDRKREPPMSKMPEIDPFHSEYYKQACKACKAGPEGQECRDEYCPSPTPCQRCKPGKLGF